MPPSHISRSHHGYHDTLRGGATCTSYGGTHGGMYPQAVQSSSLQPGTPGYDTAPHASQQPPMGPRPPTQRQMNLGRPTTQGSAGAWNPSAGSNSHHSTRTSESHSSYNHGNFQVVRQQNPRPIAAPRPPPSRGSVGVVFPQVYLDFTFTPTYLLLKTIGLRWPIGSGERLSYVIVIQSVEHIY